MNHQSPTQSTTTYSWIDAEQTQLCRTDTNTETGEVVELRIPASDSNPDYFEFVESGAEAAPYVAPPPEPVPTTEEKITNLLTDYGLSRQELKDALNS